MQFSNIMQILVALGIVNVWILRFGKATKWRGGEAQTMIEEFEVYGLPPWSVYVVGALKIVSAALLILGVWFPVVTRPAAYGLGALMLGAVAMHIKVGDPLRKSLPALTLLALCAVIAVL